MRSRKATERPANFNFRNLIFEKAFASRIANGAKTIIKWRVPQIEYGRIQLAMKANEIGANVKIRSRRKFLFSTFVSLFQSAKLKQKAIIPKTKIGNVIGKIAEASALLCSK
jgi:hypothetical protein